MSEESGVPLADAPPKTDSTTVREKGNALKEVMQASQDSKVATSDAKPRAGATLPSQDDRDSDAHEVAVKKEYVLEARAASLPPLPDVVEDDRSNKNDSRKHRKRVRSKNAPASEKLCLAILRGSDCVYGDKCKFSHDMKAFMAEREPDLEFEGGCPNFKLFGHCPFGATCRLGSSHCNMTTGMNLTQELDHPKPLPIKNFLRKEVQIQLRKRTYPFKCKRKGDKAASDPGTTTASAVQGEEPEVVPPTSTKTEVDFSPVPRMRKLIDFSNKVYIAPLTTVGNLPFRRIMKRFGADITCGEMAMGTHLLEGKPSEWALLKRHPEEDVFGVQIAAGYPDQFTRVSELLEAQTEVDFVDLNLGCPLDMVCNKGSGASLMMREKRLKDSLHGITQVLSCPVTIKMRTGWDMSKPFAHELVPKIQSWGIEGIGAIMVHGRSRLQRYAKEADWDYISRVATSQDPALPQIPVIGNGDIFSFTEYEADVAREGISSCAMLARGALIKPWLPTEIKERRHWDISASERLDMLKNFVRYGLEHWGSDQQGVNNCRRFLLEWLSFLHRYVRTPPDSLAYR